MLDKCEHCGTEAEDIDIQVFHRACRLKAAFPDSYEELGGGLVSFDMSKLKDKLFPEEKKFTTKSGVEFHQLSKIGGISVNIEHQVGNQLGTWSFSISKEEIEEVYKLFMDEKNV